MKRKPSRRKFVTPEDVETLLQSLGQPPKDSLTLRLRSVSVTALLEFFQATRDWLRILDLSNCDLQDTHVIHILPILRQSQLIELNLDGNTLSDTTRLLVENIMRNNRIYTGKPPCDRVPSHLSNITNPISHLFVGINQPDACFLGIGYDQFGHADAWKQARSLRLNALNQAPFYLEDRCQAAALLIKNPPVGFYESLKTDHRYGASRQDHPTIFLSWAAENGRADLVQEPAFQRLIEHYPLSAGNSLMIAVASKARAYVQALIETLTSKAFQSEAVCNATPQSRPFIETLADDCIQAAVCLAASINDVDMLTCILDASSCPFDQWQKRSDTNPLLLAIRSGNAAAASCLLNYGMAANRAPDVDIVGDYLHTAVRFALASENWSIVTLLLEYGADAEAAYYGKTAFDQVQDEKTRAFCAQLLAETKKLDAHKTPTQVPGRLRFFSSGIPPSSQAASSSNDHGAGGPPPA